MARRVHLVKTASTLVNVTWAGALRVRIEATEAEGLEKEVFVFRRNPLNPYTSDQLDEFMTVASPVDMSEYPIGEPDVDKAYPFFRKSVVELDFRSTLLADEAWMLIVEEVRVLTEALDRLEDLQPAEDMWIPTPPDDTDSLSDSTSDSMS